MDILSKFFTVFNEVWQSGVAGTSYMQIILSIFSFFLFIGLRGLISNILIKRIEKFVLKSSNKFDDKLTKSVKGPINFFPFVIAIFIAGSIIGFDGKIGSVFDNINKSMITVLIFWFIHQLIEPISFLIKSIEDILSRDLLNWIISSFKILIIILGTSAVLELWGIRIGPIIAGLGLFGVAVALGAQDLFKNLISGILVLVEKRFKVGDVIEVENVISGVVEKIGFRSTSVRKFDKSLCTIPNFQFAENPVTNISEITNRRINWIIGLEYSCSVEQLKNVKKEIVNFIESKKIFSDNKDIPPIVRIDQFAASSIDILVRCYTRSNDYNEWLNARDLLAVGIKEIVEKNKAGFAFPSQSIYIERD